MYICILYIIYTYIYIYIYSIIYSGSHVLETSYEPSGNVKFDTMIGFGVEHRRLVVVDDLY